MLNFARMKNDKYQGLYLFAISFILCYISILMACTPAQNSNNFAAEDSTASEAIRKINAEITSLKRQNQKLQNLRRRGI